MKKKVLLFTVASFIMFFALCLNLRVKAYDRAELGDVDLLIASPGEDASTQMNFSFHTSVEGVVVEIAKKADGNFDKAIKVTPECAAYHDVFPDTEDYALQYLDDSGAPMNKSAIKVCEAYATNLEPATEYMYRVGATNFSETRYFKTAGNDGLFSFLVMADPQVYTEGVALGTANGLMAQALEHAKKLGLDIELTLGCGDMVNDGDKVQYWRWLFDMDLWTMTPLAATTGNHDYTIPKKADKPYAVDGMYNFPKNHPDGFTESIYWFKWNSVLFITLDSEDVNHYDEQTEWFKEVVETVPHQYLIVQCHRPAWGSGDSDIVIEKWDPLFREYDVDIFFSGHNHDYGRGSCKVDGFQRSGQDKMPKNYVNVDDAHNAHNGDKKHAGGYCLVKVTTQGLQFWAYDDEDNLIDSTTFFAQRPFEESTSYDKQALMDSVKIEVSETDSTKAIVSWSKDFVGAAKYVTVLDSSDAEVNKYFVHSYNKLTGEIAKLTADTSYSYKVKVEFNDGTSETKNIDFKTTIDYGTYKDPKLNIRGGTAYFSLNPSDIKAHLFSKVNVYVNGELKDEFTADKKSYTLKDPSCVSGDGIVELKGVVKADGSEVLLATIPFGNAKVEQKLTVKQDSFTLKAGDTAKIEATADPSGKLAYESDNQRVATVAQDGTVTAVAAGSCKITVSVEGTDAKVTVTITVTGGDAPEPAGKLPAPKISLNGNTLTIEAVEGASKYEIYEGNNKLGETTSLTVDLSKFNLAEGNHDIQVKAIASGDAEDSDLSSKVTFTVEGEENPGTTEPEPEPKPDGGCSCGASAIQYVFYLLTAFGLVFVLRKKRN